MAGDGASRDEIAALLNSTDWAATPLGPRSQWPKTLEGYVSMVLEMPTPAIVFWGPEQTQLYNAGYAVIMGPRHPKYFGGSYRDCWPDTYPTIYPWMRKVLDQGETIEVERARIPVTRHGWKEEAFFTFTFSPLRDDEGRIVGIFQPVTEVTSAVLADRRAATRRGLARPTLAEAVEALSGDVSDLPFVLVYLESPDGLELRASTGIEATARAEEHARRAMLTRSSFEVPAGEVVREPPIGALEEHVRSARVLPLEASSYGALRGAVICGLSPVVRFDDAYREFVEAVVRDLAGVLAFEERHRAEKALLERERRARAQAEEANRTKDEFLATISHELRTPLNAILGWASLLTAGVLDETTEKSALATIERNARAQARLVEDVLDVSRIVTGKLTLEIARVEIASVVRAAVDVLRPAALAKSIHVESEIPADDLLALAGDAGRLQQIVWNLLSNAIRYTPAGGLVRISAGRAGDHIVVRVRDTGIGIPPDHLPYVFDRFRQVDSSTTRRHGGLGLGLAIVRHLVDLHGGTVVAESAGPGEGATFTVSLPVHAAVPAATPLENAAALLLPKDGALAGSTVLVVDDDEDSRMVIAAVLEGIGARVITAASAGEAIAAFGTEVPDLLVSDIAMPGEDGYSLIERVRRLPAAGGGTVPAIALTAHARPIDHDRAIAAGYQLHVGKPVDPALLARVAVSVARRH